MHQVDATSPPPGRWPQADLGNYAVSVTPHHGGRAREAERPGGESGLSDRLRATISRRRFAGCEDHRHCAWERFIAIPAGFDLSTVELCDFHRERAELAQETGAAMHPAAALRLHVAAWRAFT